MKKSKDRFDQLLQAMVTQPAPSVKPATKVRTSKQADDAGYGDSRATNLRALCMSCE